MKVLAVLLFVVAALAAPQVEVEEEAEVVPRKTVPGADGEVGGDGILFVINPFRNIFRNIFTRRPGFTDTEGGVLFDSNPDDTRGSGGILSLIHSLFGIIPSPSSNATVTFKNSSVTVVDLGGVPMLVNKTIVEYTDEDGSVFRRVEQRIVGPYDNSSSTPLPQDDANELEPEPSTTQKHTLKKRWIFSWVKDALERRRTPSEHSHNYLPGSEYLGNEEEEERGAETPNNLVPIRHEDDIAVNYLGGPLSHEPEAEVFDPELVRETERRFWESRGVSAGSRPLRSQPVMSQPLRSQPVMSQPLRSQPVMSQPLRSQPIMSQPLRSQPVMSQPLRSQPVMSQPLRFQPVHSVRL